MSGSTDFVRPCWDAESVSMLQETSVICRHIVTDGGFRFGPHSHMGIGIGYCMAGHGTYTIGGLSLPYQESKLIYFDSRAAHITEVQGTYIRWDVCFWPEGMLARRDNESFRRVLSNFGLEPGGVRLFHISDSDRPRFEGIFRNIREENVSRRSGFDLVIQVLLIELHLLLQRLSHENTNTTGTCPAVPDNQIAAILQYIENQLSSNLTINQIAEQFSYHPSQIYRIIRRATGLSPSTYIQDRRLMRAKSLLVENDYSISAIAASVGFNNSACFYRLFRDKTGETPMEYRNRCRLN